jgi:hypothetical protein
MCQAIAASFSAAGDHLYRILRPLANFIECDALAVPLSPVRPMSLKPNATATLCKCTATCCSAHLPAEALIECDRTPLPVQEPVAYTHSHKTMKQFQGTADAAQLVCFVPCLGSMGVV